MGPDRGGFGTQIASLELTTGLETFGTEAVIWAGRELQIACLAATGPFSINATTNLLANAAIFGLAIEDALNLPLWSLGVDNFGGSDPEMGRIWDQSASLELTTGPFHYTARICWLGGPISEATDVQ
mgnify:CR=1 FL=1